MSVTGAIVGEFVASELGLGALIISAGVTLETQSIFASLMLISLLGLALYGWWCSPSSSSPRGRSASRPQPDLYWRK